jgi:hypothetical protein
MKIDLTTGTWQDNPGCPINITLVSTSDVPADRAATLDGTFLKKLGLTKQRMLECNALFFYQLLLAIVDPSMSYI